MARFVFATNSPFRIAENKHFVALLQSLRPGYRPPNRERVSNELLDKIYEKERSAITVQLQATTVSLSLDGWSNIHNDPIVCSSITTEKGEPILLDTVDTSGHPHTAEIGRAHV